MNKTKDISILEYINLDLDNIPEEIKNTDDIDIKASEINNEKNYKVYKHIPIKDINIVLTDARRLDLPTQKLQKLNDLSFYLNKKNKEEYNTFLNLLKNTSIKDIEDIDKFQKNFKNREPSKIKYNKDYLWQIYYIERTNKYYIIVPLQEMENQCLFYIIKKKIEKSKEKIYVPICNLNFSSLIIENSKINTLENNLHFFTKEWPLVYEVYNSKNNLSLNIIGDIEIYENIKSEYKMTYCCKEDILPFYDLTKTLFYLQTEITNYYKFDMIVDEKGCLRFYYDSAEITKTSLNNFYIEEIKKNLKSVEEVEKIQKDLTKKLNKLKIEEKELNFELLNKQKQISTFLECKKSFLGRFKYFFKYGKKKNYEKKFDFYDDDLDIIENAGRIIPAYTNDIDDLIYLCKDLRTKTTVAATTRLDIQNLNIKIKILKKKIENATKYIEEIESHKKSIFEFWKFTNKDEKNQLSEGISKIEEDKKIEKKFDIKDDLCAFSKYLDSMQRKNLNLEEQNAIFVGATIGIENITKPEHNLKDLISNSKFKNINYDILNHREKKKNIANILGNIDEFNQEDRALILKKIYKNIHNSFKKCIINHNFSAYSLQKPENKIMLFEINPQKLDLDGEEKEIYKINLKPGTGLLALSNIIFFNNRNDTLPIGMDYTTNVFVDLRKADLIEVSKKTNNIIKLSEKSSAYKITKIHITEFNI